MGVEMHDKGMTCRTLSETRESGGPHASRSQLKATNADLRLEVEALQAQVDHLCRALDSSRWIGAAVGIVMQQLHLTQSDAFEFLVSASQHLNIKLRDVAGDIVTTGNLEPALQALKGSAIA